MKKGEKKFIQIGNIFDFAEARLQKKVSRGDIEYYTINDVIDNAIKIRKYLDKNPRGLTIPTRTKEERRLANLKARKLYLWNKMMSLRG